MQLNPARSFSPNNYDYLHTLGAALYRAGRFKESIEKLEHAIKVQGGLGGASAWLFLAMAHHRLGHAGEAAKWLGKAVRWIDSETQKDRNGLAAAALPWDQRLELKLLRSEAEALLHGMAADPKR
jgi:tetratricopeptide (TPR) repeat protein